MQLSKLCRNLCSLRWLKPNRKRVRSFNPMGSYMSYTLFAIGRMNDNNRFLNTSIDSEFLIVISKLNQSFNVDGKKEIFVAVCSTVKFRYMVSSCPNRLMTVWD